MIEIPHLDPDREAYLDRRDKPSSVAVPAWPRRDKILAKVELETQWVRFSVLNFRTRVEQDAYEKKHGTPNLFREDPLGPAAQEAQYQILRSQPGFDRLKEDLQLRGQQEPAIVTADGVLINGNRRSAALRSLYVDDGERKGQYVECLVLPKDATVEEMTDLEAELQVAETFQEDYGWLNDALLIEHYLDRENKDWAKVAKRLHRGQNYVEAQYDKLLLVRQLVGMSQGARLLEDFVDNESAFTELSRHIKNKSQAEAEAIKFVYFLGTLANVEYRNLRHLQVADAADLVLAQLEDDPECQPLLDAAAELSVDAPEGRDPLDELLGETNNSGSESTIKSLLSLVAQKPRETSLALPDGSKMDMPTVLGRLKTTVVAAAKEAQEQERDRNQQSAPIKRAESALADLQRVKTALPTAQRHNEFDGDKLIGNLDEILTVVSEIRDLL